MSAAATADTPGMLSCDSEFWHTAGTCTADWNSWNIYLLYRGRYTDLLRSRYHVDLHNISTNTTCHSHWTRF